MEKLTACLQEFQPLQNLVDEENMLNIQLNGSTTTFELNEFLIDKGVIVTHLAERKGNLEQKFLKILEESDDQTV
jgi:ABC-2 type transport system ATP-binding protein